MPDVLYGVRGKDGTLAPYNDERPVEQQHGMKIEGHHVMIHCGCGDPDSHAKLGKHCPTPEPLRVTDYRSGSRRYNKAELLSLFQRVRDNHFRDFGIIIPE